MRGRFSRSSSVRTRLEKVQKVPIISRGILMAKFGSQIDIGFVTSHGLSQTWTWWDRIWLGFSSDIGSWSPNHNAWWISSTNSSPEGSCMYVAPSPIGTSPSASYWSLNGVTSTASLVSYNSLQLLPKQQVSACESISFVDSKPGVVRCILHERRNKHRTIPLAP